MLNESLEKQLSSNNPIEFYPIVKRAGEIYDRLTDDESRRIFEARLEFMCADNEFDFYDKLDYTHGKWHAPEFEVFYKKAGSKPIVIWGAGKYGRYVCRLLLSMGFKDLIFCDNNVRLHNATINGIVVLPPERLQTRLLTGIVIIATKLFREEIYTQLYGLGVSPESVFSIDSFCAFCGWQYFDVFSPKENETFVDGGGYDGMTSLEFLKWCDNNYSDIYCFEPDQESLKYCKSNLSGISDVHIIPKGLYSHSTQLRFDNSGAHGGHKVSESGCLTIDVTSIDETLDGQRASLIKLDVEGAEAESLIGAQKTIKMYKPRLAVCVYHYPYDILRLPALILDMLPDYKLTLRHYASNLCETVLYASID